MKYLYNITNIVNSKGDPLSGWTMSVSKSHDEYQTKIFYKDGMIYWISPFHKGLTELISETIDKIEWIIRNIPEDALNSKQEWSHVKSFGNYYEREFVMLLKSNGRAQLKRFCKTNDIFNLVTNFIPDSIEMLDEDWCHKSN